MTGSVFTRRDFLRLAAGGALAASGIGCSSGPDKAKAGRSAATTAGAKARPALRIAQWNHYVAG
ncbi:MAG TPA: twin-arginine translocation signal domain-containing protein, partial [Acidimicrobiia bacterium]